MMSESSVCAREIAHAVTGHPSVRKGVHELSLNILTANIAYRLDEAMASRGIHAATTDPRRKALADRLAECLEMAVDERGDYEDTLRKVVAALKPVLKGVK